MKRLLFALALLLVVGCGTTPQPTAIPITLAETAHRVIVDTDMSVDDMIALLYLLSRPDVNVLAITISGTGITRCDAGIRNTYAILEVMDRTNIPVACGRETPLSGNHAFPDEWRDAAETFFGVNLRPSKFVTPNETAVALFTRTLQASDAKATVLALGPLTNLAEAFRQTPTLTSKIDVLYSMGGAVNLPGNVQAAPYAEWNFYADPVAAQETFASSIPITLVPLDATNHVPVTRDTLQRFSERQNTPAAKLAYRLLQNQRGEIERGTYYLWDVLAAVVLTDSSVAPLQDIPLAVDHQNGRTKQDVNGIRVRVATNADASRFEATVLQTLNVQFK